MKLNSGFDIFSNRFLEVRFLAESFRVTAMRRASLSQLNYLRRFRG